MGTLVQDMRYGIRMLAREPGLAAIAILSLALGIGANSTIFSIVDGLLLRPWPVDHSEELVAVFTGSEKEPQGLSSYDDYLELRAQTALFSGVTAWGTRGAFVSAAGRGELAAIDVVSDDYFQVLGVKAALGRTFVPAESLGSGDSGVVLSYALWQRLFGGDPSLVGRPIQMDGKSVLLLGVAPRGFRGLKRVDSTDVWATPKGWSALVGGGESEFHKRDNRWFQLEARLRPGVEMKQVKAQLETISSRLAQDSPATNKGMQFLVVTPADELRAQLGPAVFLLAAVGLVLLIACANVAGLLLAHNERRRREIAMRLALGAGRGRLVRQLLAESAILAPAGGLLGLVLARWLIQVIPTLMPSPEALGPDVQLDMRVVAFTVVVCLLTSLIFGLVPAFQASRCDLVPILKGEHLQGAKGGLPIRRLLVVGEVSLSVILLTASALLLRSLLRTRTISPGFDPGKNVLILDMVPPDMYGYNDTQTMAIYESLMDRFRALPGVREASYARRPLLTANEGGETEEVFVPGVKPRKDGHGVPVRYNIVSPTYLRTMGTRIVSGRGFEHADGPGSTRVVLINQTMARLFWPNSDALGEWLRIGKEQYQVVGVTEDGKYLSIHETAQPYLFFPFAQKFSGEASLFVETAGDSRSTLDAVMKAARTTNPQIPIMGALSLKEHMNYALYEERTASNLVGGLALLGIFLAAVGLYGVISYAVSRETHAIGIRMALGAERWDVLRWVVAEGLRLAAVGIAVGLAASLAVTRLMSAYLYGVQPTDPLSFAASSAAVVLVAVAASYFPARRATRLEPTAALRYE